MKSTSKLGTLILLINSLSKAEKRYFRLLANLQTGDKIYLFLFGLLEKNKSEEDICNEFQHRYSGKSLETAGKHLYTIILDALVRLREKQDIQTQTFHSISKSNLLFERGLIEEAFSELDKAFELATSYENDSLTLLIYRTELKYHSSLNFNKISEKQLVAKQMRIHEIMKYTRSINLHLQLYNILKYRIIHKGHVRSDKQKSNLNDLVLSELNLMANNSYRGFEAEKLHLLFQATYYLNSGNYKSALRLYEELIYLFEKNTHLLLNPPIYYLSTLRGILDSLHTMGLYKEMPFFLSKLSTLEKQAYPVVFLFEVRWLNYFYQLVSLLNTGDFEKACALFHSYEDSLYKKTHLLNPEHLLQLYLYTSILYLSLHDLVNARKYMKKIISSGKFFYPLPSYKTARLINLLLQAESGKLEVIENEINSIKRTIHLEKHAYITEKLIFRFVSAYPLPAYPQGKKRLWLQYKKDMEIIRNNKYEQQLLKTFDFLSWIESILTQRPFAEIIKDKE